MSVAFRHLRLYAALRAQLNPFPQDQMKTKYLSGAQATAISKDFQHLVGQPFGDDDGSPSTRPITLVTIAPYSRILQWSFGRLIAKGTPITDALNQWPLDRFEVILLSFQPNAPHDFRLKDLRSYLEETSQPLDMTSYRRGATRASAGKTS